MKSTDLLDQALLLDLETGPSGRILKTGAVLGGRATTVSGSAAHELAALAREARAVVGHNLAEHDLARFRQAHPDHPLLGLPVVDTLLLSPICFPRNPYHRLVKDYKLVSESVNDPVADARLAGVLFADEHAALARLKETEPGIFALLHFLLAEPDDPQDRTAAGFELLFRSLGHARPSREAAAELAQTLFPRWGCSRFVVTGPLVAGRAARMALAYVLAWLPVAGSASVLPPWVRARHPQALEWIGQLRDTPCRDPGCGYCAEAHDARGQLQKFFGFDDFRHDPGRPGQSLQRAIVEAGMRGEPLLAILPTGGGKSLCFQLPALARNFRRGVLTIVISPLQALMKDQVDGLARRTGTPFAAALYGMLTPPERGDVLRRIAMGDLAILYVSPEQLRNRSFAQAIAQREIGCWVFDEAHCFSKWGHDFRSDYLYAGRFIREFSARQGGRIPAIACFTATAKLEVQTEILQFFKNETGQELRLFEGGVERANLVFAAQPVTAAEKLERVDLLLSEQFSLRGRGSALVFRSKRKLAEQTAEFLAAKGWLAAFFHAGLTPSRKKEVQDSFLAGETQVICATNAFGMGIDKEDVRLVIHADTPGSLENYLQEAGRAGRDQLSARCVLLCDEQDAEWQFRMSAASELTRRDLAGILRTLRKARRGGRDEVVITAGEILRDEEFQGDLEGEGNDAGTKVRTGISWLERAGFLQRDENVTSVFQARLLVRNLEEAQTKMAGLHLSAAEQSLWTAILRRMMNAGSAESLTVDELALLPEFGAYSQAESSPAPARDRPRSHDHVSAKILKILRAMSEAGLVKRDTLLNAFVDYKVANHSVLRLERVLRADRKLTDLLALAAPDAEDWMTLSLPLLNQQLLDEGIETAPELVRLLIKSLSEDGRGLAGSQGSLDLHFAGRDAYRVKVNRSWRSVNELAEKRRRVAALILATLMAKIPAETPPRADLLVDFSFEELTAALDRDLLLRAEIKEVEPALERGLMYLHEQEIIKLQQGLAVFRSAMTIRFRPEANQQKYRASDYQPLAHFYRERIFQIHIMGEYARRATTQIQDALKLVLAYFTLNKEEFVRRYFGGRKELLEHATTARSFQKIVTDLANPAQIRVVTAPRHRNMLILAGPGSGKSRVVVHRCAWLLRVERVRPQSILICCFNRQAAVELRRRLEALAGEDARGVTVSTYHSLAMRLLGHSFAGARSPETLAALGEVIPRAARLLRGEVAAPGIEADEVRDRLLAGFEHILVDEYQDIDHDQYELISALAGRTLEDADLKLSILAVGDDDQNIYTFRGANVQFIQRFREDYDAEIHCLVENYRSTAHLIAAANQLIEGNQDRMKIGRPIRINSGRAWLGPGGAEGSRDPLTGGRVQVIRARTLAAQSRAVLAELQRLRNSGLADWPGMAVLARTHRELAAVRALAEQAGIPFQWWADRRQMPPLHQIREVHHLLEWLRARGAAPVRAGALLADYSCWLQDSPSNPWAAFVRGALESWQAESLEAELPASEALEFVWSLCAEGRGSVSCGQGVILGTIHAAKGTEHDHVLLTGSWPDRGAPDSLEELRRVLYVGMTRARHTLAIFDRRTSGGSLLDRLEGPHLLRREAPEDSSAAPAELDYAVLGPENINLGFPALFDANHPIHGALARLRPGCPVRLAADESGVAVTDAGGLKIARLSRKAAEVWSKALPRLQSASVVAMVRRTAGQELRRDPGWECRAAAWEIPVLELAVRAPAPGPLSSGPEPGAPGGFGRPEIS